MLLLVLVPRARRRARARARTRSHVLVLVLVLLLFHATERRYRTRDLENPLLTLGNADGVPAFDRIRPEHAEPAIDEVLAHNRAQLEALLSAATASPVPPTWDELVEPLADMNERLARAWGPVVHLFAVTSTTAWRAAHNACLPKVTQYQVELSQNGDLFRGYQRLASGPTFANLSQARQKTIRDALRDFKLSGVGLPDDARARFGEIALRLSELSAKFQENVIDSAQAWSKHVTDEALVAGMTAQGKAAARAKAQAKSLDGYRLTLDFPSYDAVMSYADNRELRRELYEAYSTRASDQGPLAGRFDNGSLMDEMLRLRHEQARILGLKNYVEVSLATKMAKSSDEVERFLLDLNARARRPAQAELGELKSFAKKSGGPSDFQVWDFLYYGETRIFRGRAAPVPSSA